MRRIVSRAGSVLQKRMPVVGRSAVPTFVGAAALSSIAMAGCAATPLAAKRWASTKADAPVLNMTTSQPIKPHFFTVGWGVSIVGQSCVPSTVVTLYDPSTKATMAVNLQRPDEFPAVVKWVREVLANNEKDKAFVVPMHQDATFTLFAKHFGNHMEITCDAWGTIHSVFREHSASVMGGPPPKSIEEAYKTVAGETFRLGPNEIAGANIDGNDARACGFYAATLTWHTLKSVLSSLGSRQSTEEQILNRTSPPVQVLSVALEAAADSIADRTKYRLSVTDPATQKTKKFAATSLTDTKFQQDFVTSMCKAGTTTALMVTGDDMKVLSALFRGTKHISPFFLLQLRDVALAFPNMCTRNPDVNSPPKADAEFWSFGAEKLGLKSPEDLVRMTAAVAQKRQRSAVVGVVASKRQFIEPSSPLCTGALPLKTSSGASASESSAKKRAFVVGMNSRKEGVGEAMESLKQWTESIYKNDQRWESEAKAASTMNRYLVLDLETTTKKKYKRVANPFLEENHVVLPGLKDYKGTVLIPPEYMKERTDMKLPDLTEYDVIVGHNLKFDLLYLWADPQLKKFLARGGKIWDTMYAEYLLTGHVGRLGTGVGLDQVAKKYGGTIEKLDEVKQAWEAGMATQDIPHATLAKYLRGDLDNTELIYKHQLERATKQLQMLSCQARMDGLLCTTEMEFNGLHIDKDRASKAATELKQKINDLRSTLDEKIPSQIPHHLRKHWNWGSTVHLAALYFGGDVTFNTGGKGKGGNEVGPPHDITAAVEIAHYAGARKGLEVHYYTPYLRAKGLNKSANRDTAIDSSHVPKTYRVLIAHVRTTNSDASKCHACELQLFDPFTEQEFTTCIAPREGTALGDCSDLSGRMVGAPSVEVAVKNAKEFIADGDHTRTVLLSYNSSLFTEEVLRRHGLQSDDIHFADALSTIKCFNAKAKKMKVKKESLPEVTNMSSAREVWQQVSKTLPQDEEKTREALLTVLGQTVPTSQNCFLARSIETEKEAVVSFPGLLQQYFPDATERTNFCKKYTSSVSQRFQVGEASLKEFSQRGEALAQTMLDLRTLEKLHSTFYESEGHGMMALVHEHDSCIHHELIHNKTATGRLASANPNCQNIPKEDTLRAVFTPRFASQGKASVNIEADYSQLEVITLCVLADDTQMLKDIQSGVDFHCKRVTMMRPEFSYEEVYERAKIKKDPEMCKLRQQAKIFSFQRQYGAGVAMLSESTGLSPDEIRVLIENERKVYPGVDRFYNMVTASVHSFDVGLQDGTRSKVGDFLYKGMFPVKTGSRFVFTQSETPATLLEKYPSMDAKNFKPTMLKNWPVQGFAGEIVQIMLGKLWRHFAANNNYDGKALLTNTVHDCVWIDAEVDVAEQVGRDVNRIMSSAKDVLNETWPDMNVKAEFPVDVVWGPNMSELKSFKF